MRPWLVALTLNELGRRHGIADEIELAIARYAEESPAVLAALVGGRFPPPPAWPVGGADDFPY